MEILIRFEHHQHGVIITLPFELHRRGGEPFDVHFDTEWHPEPSDSVLLDRIMRAHHGYHGIATVRQTTIFLFGGDIHSTKRLIFRLVEELGATPVEDMWYVPA